MTNFEKIKEYYKSFDENNRLNNDYSGKLEFEMTMKILKKYLPTKAKILDLGGASGVYSFPLADLGYEVYLADLSDKLINEAKEKNIDCKVVSCDVVNAIDLSIYSDNSFDVVLLFGPLYHLVEKSEREMCISEVKRVLKDNGLVFASFIPFLSGSIAIIDRYFRHPEQVNIDNLSKVFETGQFNNMSDKGFQEGYYPRTEEIYELFNEFGFDKIDIKSIRGLEYEKEEKLYSVKDVNIFEKILEIIEKTSDEKEIIEMCGHAMYIGKNRTINGGVL
jgi:2-polyprenyl-3-methyl-5-hydroxy-6-metoxy-1,4-benzoquinol methylase